MSPVSLPDEVRASCAWVAERARFVRIDEDAIEAYAAGLVAAESAGEPDGPVGEDPEAAAAFAICMNAINFGSGWWPTIRKRPGRSGYATMEAGVREQFDSVGHWSADELIAMDGPTIARVVGQDPEHPLMAQFAAALRDAGERLLSEHRGRFLGVIDGADSIPALAGVLAGWDAFADTSLHVLRVDRVLELDPHLTARIEAEELLGHGSREEVELRACAVQAIELLSAARGLDPAEIDSALWNRGRGPLYKSLPRPRSRNTAY